MIYTYGVTQRGYYHIKKDIVCQDAHAIKQIAKDCCIAAVADGLGSELYTDKASRIAVDTVVEYCSAHINVTSPSEQILLCLQEAYHAAIQAIEQEALSSQHEINQYDTTLTCALLIGETLYYGHSGDSGIIALLKSGEFQSVTAQQRDESGCVYPLCFTDKWKFGSVQGVASVLLATDGMLDTLFPSLLFNEPINIYVALASYLMDNDNVGFETLTNEQVQEKMEKFVSGIAEAQVSDDKTIVAIINVGAEKTRQPEEYYQVPNWAELKRKKDEEFRRLAYPHMYKKEE